MTGQELLTFLREIEETNPDILSKNIKVLNLEDEDPFYHLYGADIIDTEYNNDVDDFVEVEPYIRLAIE